MSGGKKKPDQSRARAEDESSADDIAVFETWPEDREGRVRFVMAIMAKGQWDRGKTGKVLAAAVGLASGTIDHIASEASRRIKTILDVGQVRQRLATALDQAIDQGLQDRSPRDVAACSKAYASLVGAEAPTKHEVTGKDGAPLYQGREMFDKLMALKPSHEELDHFARTGELPAREKSN